MPRDALPHLSEALAKEYIAKACECMQAHGWTAESQANGKPPQTTDAAADGGDFDNIYGDREQKYARAALDGCAAELASTAEGSRNEKLNAIAFAVAWAQ